MIASSPRPFDSWQVDINLLVANSRRVQCIDYGLDSDDVLPGSAWRVPGQEHLSQRRPLHLDRAAQGPLRRHGTIGCRVRARDSLTYKDELLSHCLTRAEGRVTETVVPGRRGGRPDLHL
jgi:hypothetical protein